MFPLSVFKASILFLAIAFTSFEMVSSDNNLFSSSIFFEFESNNFVYSGDINGFVMAP